MRWSSEESAGAALRNRFWPMACSSIAVEVDFKLQELAALEAVEVRPGISFRVIAVLYFADHLRVTNDQPGTYQEPFA
jgi:hypothetical protein